MRGMNTHQWRNLSYDQAVHFQLWIERNGLVGRPVDTVEVLDDAGTAVRVRSGGTSFYVTCTTHPFPLTLVHELPEIEETAAL